MSQRAGANGSSSDLGEMKFPGGIKGVCYYRSLLLKVWSGDLRPWNHLGACENDRESAF